METDFIRGGTEHVELDVKGPQKDVSRALSAVDGVNEVAMTVSLGRGLFSYVVTAKHRAGIG